MQVSRPILAELPVEILDDILSWLLKEGVESDLYIVDLKETLLSRLYPLLFLNKRIGSRAVARLYQHPKPFLFDKWKSENLLKTLLSSIRGTAYYSYYALVF